MEGVGEERVDRDLEDDLGREGNGAEVQEFGMGRTGPRDRSSDNTTPTDERNAPGGLRLPLGRGEPLNQPSRDTVWFGRGRWGNRPPQDGGIKKRGGGERGRVEGFGGLW